MFSALILVAIFSSVLPFEAEAQQHIPKCNEGNIRKIYAYWHSNGGVPQQITERVSITLSTRPCKRHSEQSESIKSLSEF